ncbi:MAG: putative lipoprotein [Arenicella sp.]|jgi:uncharacterized lipoprotein
MNKFAISIRVMRTAGLLVLASVLIGCGGSKTVITADDSAEYRNAVSLPPLKKPTKAPANFSEVESATQSNQQSAIDKGSSDQLASDSVKAKVRMNAPTIVGKRPVGVVTNAQVIELASDIARLKIDADFDAAWNYLSENLKRSNITVHTRSKTAQRFSIGCASLQGQSADSVKGSGWSFFAKKRKPTEHCSLLLVSARSAIEVKLLNRSGAEYASADSKALFARLLNN